MPAQLTYRILDQRAEEIGTNLLGELVKARKTADLSKQQLADRSGIDLKAISRLERGAGAVEALTAVMAALDFQLVGVARGNTLGEQLAASRRKLNLSIEDITTKTDVPNKAVEELETGKGATRYLFRVLALLAPRVRRRAPERAYWGQGKKADRDSRFTPPDFLDKIYDAFGPVDLDPCAHSMSPVVAHRRIILEEGGNGLTETWSGQLAFVNPPYSAQLVWLKRAHQQWASRNVGTVICLVPVRTDNAFFHGTLRNVADLFFLKGRLRFASVRGDVQSTPFSLMVVALGATAKQKRRFAKLANGFWVRASHGKR